MRNVPILLDDAITVRSLRAEHIGVIISKRRNLVDLINSRTKCILYESGDTAPSQTTAEVIANCGAFALNVFAKHGAIACSTGFVIKYIKAHSLSEVMEISNYNDPGPLRYEIVGTTDPAAIRTLYASALIAIDKDKSLAITLRRFNSSIAKSANEERLIDLTICLESIFNSQTEISFRFSLYNALLAGIGAEERNSYFLILKRLYKERSNLVHGNKAIDNLWINENWEVALRIAKLSVLKKIYYLQDNAIADWQSRLDSLALEGNAVG